MDNALSLLGLIYKAKKLYFGEQCLDSFKDIKLLIIASDISIKSKERYLKKCEFYKVNYCDLFNSEQIRNALGKNNVKVIGITDVGFSKLFLSKIGG